MMSLSPSPASSAPISDRLRCQSRSRPPSSLVPAMRTNVAGSSAARPTNRPSTPEARRSGRRWSHRRCRRTTTGVDCASRSASQPWIARVHRLRRGRAARPRPVADRPDRLVGDDDPVPAPGIRAPRARAARRVTRSSAAADPGAGVRSPTHRTGVMPQRRIAATLAAIRASPSRWSRRRSECPTST